MVIIAPHETLLLGVWSVTTHGMKADATCSRIDALVQGVIIKVAARAGAWDQLFRDPSDGRLWELTYPQSEMHGGGPPCLKAMSSQQALSSFGYSASV
jgi:hypothetical protein